MDEGNPAAPAQRLQIPGGARTRQALEARALPARAADDDETEPLRVPFLKGETVDRLRAAAARRGPELEVVSEAQLRLHRPAERGAVAVACLLLETIRRAGGARTSPQALQSALERALEGLRPAERVAVEVEVYEILQWIGGALGGHTEPAQDDEEPLDAEPHHEKVSLIERAISLEQDLEIRYFTGGRAELTWRRVTPHRLEARKFLHAWCHKRQDERVFRVSRIGRMRLLDAPPAHEARAAHQLTLASPPAAPPPSGQMSLLGD
jgi:hypothetical protein